MTRGNSLGTFSSAALLLPPAAPLDRNSRHMKKDQQEQNLLYFVLKRLIENMAGSTTAVAFKWLDLLEKEFDKSYVSLDQHLAAVLRILREEEEAIDAYDAQRKLLSNMAQCFVQLSHKAQSIFQTNAKLEAELVHAREEMSKSKATMTKVDSEKKYLICCLQSALLENHKLKASANGGPLTEEQENEICGGIQVNFCFVFGFFFAKSQESSASKQIQVLIEKGKVLS